MPVRYQIFPDYQLIITRHSGLVSSRELLEIYRAMFEDERNHPGFQELIDLRQIYALDVTLDGMRQVSELTAAYQQGSQTKTAVVCNQTIYEIVTKLYQTIAESDGAETVTAFQNVSAALQWLDQADFPLASLDFQAPGSRQ